MWMDQNFPAGEMRKLHIHGNKAQVEAAIQEVEFLMNSAPVNNSRSGKGVEVRFLFFVLIFLCLERQARRYC